MHRSVAPWNLGPLLVRELSVCRESVAFTTDMSGAKPLDQRLPRLRSAHQTSRMNFENRQASWSGLVAASPENLSRTSRFSPARARGFVCVAVPQIRTQGAPKLVGVFVPACSRNRDASNTRMLPLAKMPGTAGLSRTYCGMIRRGVRILPFLNFILTFH